MRTGPIARALGRCSGHCICLQGTATLQPRDASEGKGPQRRPRKRLGRRLEEVAKAVGGGYCRLQMPLRLAVAVGGTVAGVRLGALEGVGVTSPPSNASVGPPSTLVALCCALRGAASEQVRQARLRPGRVAAGAHPLQPLHPLHAKQQVQPRGLQVVDHLHVPSLDPPQHPRGRGVSRAPEGGARRRELGPLRHVHDGGGRPAEDCLEERRRSPGRRRVARLPAAPGPGPTRRSRRPPSTPSSTRRQACAVPWKNFLCCGMLRHASTCTCGYLRICGKLN